MNIQTTQWLVELLIVFVNASKVAALVIPLVGICTCAALFVRETIWVVPNSAKNSLENEPNPVTDNQDLAVFGHRSVAPQ